MLRLLAIFMIWTPLAIAQSPTSQVSRLKIYQTQHLRIYFAPMFRNEVKLIAQNAETFLADLETRWSVKLPEKRLNVSLSKGNPEKTRDHINLPEWLSSRYLRNINRVDLIVADMKDFESSKVLAALRHHLIHHLLTLSEDNRLPPYLEEGFARYYAEQSGVDMFTASWAFHEYIPAAVALNSPDFFNENETFVYRSELAFAFAEWLWREHPESELRFIQFFLSGESYEEALRRSNLEPSSYLLTEFDQKARIQYDLSNILKTSDFWLMVSGVLALLFFLFSIVRAIRISLIPFSEIEHEEDQESEAPEELFTGPAFGFTDKEESDPEEEAVLDLDSVRKKSQKLPSLSDWDGASITTPPVPRAEDELGPMDTPPIPVGISTPPVPDMELLDSDNLPDPIREIYEFDSDLNMLEDDVEKAFEGLSPKKTTSLEDEIEANLDSVFDEWEGS